MEHSEKAGAGPHSGFHCEMVAGEDYSGSSCTKVADASSGMNDDDDNKDDEGDETTTTTTEDPCECDRVDYPSLQMEKPCREFLQYLKKKGFNERRKEHCEEMNKEEVSDPEEEIVDPEDETDDTTDDDTTGDCASCFDNDQFFCQDGAGYCVSTRAECKNDATMIKKVVGCSSIVDPVANDDEEPKPEPEPEQATDDPGPEPEEEIVDCSEHLVKGVGAGTACADTPGCRKQTKPEFKAYKKLKSTIKKYPNAKKVPKQCVPKEDDAAKKLKSCTKCGDTIIVDGESTDPKPDACKGCEFTVFNGKIRISMYGHKTVVQQQNFVNTKWLMMVCCDTSARFDNLPTTAFIFFHLDLDNNFFIFFLYFLLS